VARRRLDAELVRRSLARSRENAQDLIASGRVRVKGTVAAKAATQVEEADSIVVEAAGDPDHYVSRGAHKLLGALAAFPDLVVSGRDCLDAGASTGGFTQVLLERGANRVLAVDVGYGQLAWPVRTDPRVHVVERTNVRSLTRDALDFVPSLVVADLSFIPLELVLPALVSVSSVDADLLVMVKPQFEVGREAVGDGVVRDPELRASAVRGVADAAIGLGLIVVAVAPSPLPGPRGNVEYFLRLSGRGGKMDVQMEAGLSGDTLQEAIDRAVKEGPQ
jgi:23S rRNA (cytidine1920-2'-O)/16S rRNA (cytidine1409-2'-O)-methyltransferase